MLFSCCFLNIWINVVEEAVTFWSAPIFLPPLYESVAEQRVGDELPLAAVPTAFELTNEPRSITCKIGESVYVKLSRNAGTAYWWQSSTSSEAISAIKLGFVRATSGQEGAVGFEVFDVFQITVKEAGTYEIKFNLATAKGKVSLTRQLTVIAN